jgi:hypothetical protein
VSHRPLSPIIIMCLLLPHYPLLFLAYPSYPSTAGILEEFERTRSSYATLLDRERLASKKRLADRKGRNRGGDSKMDDHDDGKREVPLGK